MAASEGERAQFGQRLRALRGERTLQEVARLLEHDHELVVSPQSLSQWERGQSAPSKRATVEIVDEALAANGQLLEALGYAPTDSMSDTTRTAIEAQVSSLADRVDRLERMVREIAERG